MRYYLGIDGGGTKTDAALCDETGRVAARALGPAGNLVDIGVPPYGVLPGELLDGLAQQTGGALPPVAAAFAGLSGGSDQKIAAACRQLLQDRLPATPLVAGGDDRQSLLAGGLYGADGCVLISGTGCACTARVNGRLHSIGGWGFLFDGRGGGFDIGRDAVMAALRALDGRGEPTLLRPLLEAELGCGIEEALPGLYREGKRRIASLAPLVFRAAQEGDAAASAILDENMRELAFWLDTAAKDFDGPFPTVVAGGILMKSDDALCRLRSFVKSETRPVRMTMAPVFGAVIAAMLLDGVPEERLRGMDFPL